MPAQLNMPVGLSVVSMLALWSGLHLLSFSSLGNGESGAGTTSSGSSSDSGGQSDKEVSSFVRWVIPDPPEGMCYYEHTKVKTLHLVLDGHTRKLCVWALDIGPLHRKLQEQPSPAYSRCRLCSKFADSR